MSTPEGSDRAPCIAAPLGRVEIELRGAVQGVGLRPRVVRAARGAGLGGWIRNEPCAVVLQVEGARPAIEHFLVALRALPLPVRIDALSVREVAQRGETTFEIVASTSSDAGALDVVSPDLGVCDACLREVRERHAQRSGYAFTSCAECGPRYSIVRALPFDRARTSLQDFVPCTLCAAQYASVGDRRFHAQTIACPDCGPKAQLRIGDEAVCDGALALQRAAELLVCGKIVAILGIGGFQLLVDASDSAAVARLRQRKHRPSKPLAVLFKDPAQLLEFCSPSTAELAAVRSATRPIVLMQRAAASAHPFTPCQNTAEGSTWLGALLPPSPLHALLADRVGRPLICTSGNVSEEPILFELAVAERELAGIADALLVHDRPVLRPLDDSLLQCIGERSQLLRRARGYVPSKVARLPSARTILALGGHLKNSFALCVGGTVNSSPHLGDLQGEQARERQRAEVLAWLELAGVRPEWIACDLHPGYASTQLAEELARSYGAERVQVQHHHAHVAAVLAEHDRQAPTLGLAWDGAGYGCDHTLWGGEVLLCAGHQFTRVAHLAPFALPGAERASRQPRRSLLGALHAAGLWKHAAALTDFDGPSLEILEHALERRVQAPLTSSVGRLFDAVAALLGLRAVCDYEGQAASELMQRALRVPGQVGAYALQVSPEGVIEWQPMLTELTRERLRGVDVDTLARRFHETLVGLIVHVAREHSDGTLVLSGGCFQNRLLLTRALEELSRHGIVALTAWAVPPNDGGLALGQAWVAAQHALAQSAIDTEATPS